jgi:hypothetical protein
LKPRIFGLNLDHPRAHPVQLGLCAQAPRSLAAREGFERKRPARRPLPDHLPRERLVHPAPTVCSCCGSTTLRKIGEDVTETLEHVPSSWKVIQHVREKFSCRLRERRHAGHRYDRAFDQEQLYRQFRTPHTEKLHVVERFTIAADGKTLTALVKVEDPDTFNAPLAMQQRWVKMNAPLGESVCAENHSDYFHQNLFPLPERRPRISDLLRRRDERKLGHVLDRSDPDLNIEIPRAGPTSSSAAPTVRVTDPSATA